MKIAMLIDWWDPPIFGWWQMHVKYLCEWLVRNHDCSVDLFVRKLIGDDEKKYTKNEHHWKRNVYRIWPTTKFFTIWWRLICLFTTTIVLLFKTIRKNYDIIHAHAYVSWLPAKIVGFLTKTPVVYTVHWTMWLDAKKQWFLAKIERRLICGIKYDLEISVSNKIFDYKNINKNIKVLHNWVDIDKYDSVAIEEKYKWMVFLRVGRFDRQKWLEFLIEWIRKIDKKFLQEKWFILNLVWDWDLVKNIKFLVNKYNLEDFVNFRGKIFGDDLIKEYKKNHIFILPSLAEWQPLTLLEAMASKLSVIVTDVWDNKYFVKNNINWYIVQPWDSNDLKKSIESILNIDTETLDKIWKENYSFAQKYNRKNVIKETYNKYLSVLKN